MACIVLMCVGTVAGAVAVGLVLRAVLLPWWTTDRHACQVFCPGCHTDLTKTAEPWGYTELGLVWYACACGVKSRWDFDVPVPILISKKDGGSDG